MRDETKALRRAEIEAAAYRVLSEKGFQNMSMLAVAKAAKASNETLYRWYGDKVGLFTALIEANAAAVSETLRSGIDGATDSRAALAKMGVQLLELLLGDRAIALNRAAAADASGVLGAVLAREGRGKVFPLIRQLFAGLIEEGQLDGDADEAARLYVDLLVGDMQIRRAIGALPPPEPDFVRDRARLAEARLFALMAPDP